MLMSPALIHYHLHHSALFPLLVGNFWFHREEPGSHHLPFIFLNCSTPVYIYSAIRIADLYPCGKNLYQLEYVQCLCTVSIAFSLTDPSHSHSYLAYHCFPPPAVRLFHTFVIQLDCVVTFSIPSRDFTTF